MCSGSTSATAAMTSTGARYDIIRAVEEEIGRPIGVLADLQGPKLRVGRLAAGPLELGVGERVRFDLDPAPGSARAGAAAASRGVRGPGAGRPAAARRRQDPARGRDGRAPGPRRRRVLVGGTLSDRKGVSVVGAVLPVSALTEKDRRDLAFALPLGVDWVALSFVQRPEDMDEVRALGGRAGRPRGQAGEARGDRAAGRDRRPLGRGHGGARRPRRRDAAREGADHPAPDPARLPRAPASR